LKFGVIAPNLNSPRKIAELAILAEKVGFDHFLLSDHYYMPEYRDMLDSWVIISNIAGITSTLRLGTCVSPITFRPPLQFAKIITSVDHVSNGRVIVGVGAGWVREEYEMFSRYYPEKERFQQFKEALHLLTSAWSEEEVSFAGKYYSAKNVVVEPKPIQKPHPPLLFGGWGKRMVRLAGMKGNGWIPVGPRSGEVVKTPEEYSRFAKSIEIGLQRRDVSPANFVFGCRFGPMEQTENYLSEVEAFSKAGLNAYQLYVRTDTHSTKTLLDFGDAAIATH
jgi:alkanesulfonate monooxygenase SsuD/methylene tetrahydromethanopterin reductase-like flavin-dependent oxidoreductase (luciferase family)